MDPKTNHIQQKHWYAYRIFHNKIKNLKLQLEEDNIQFFTPFRLIQEKEENKIVYREVPIIPSLFFIRSTESYMKELKKQYTTHLSVYVDPCTHKEAIIPDNEMEIFQDVISKGCNRIEVVDEKFIKGNHVRITGGLFEGAEGYITRIHGTKRFVVLIKGVTAVATTFVPRCYIEKIDDF